MREKEGPARAGSPAQRVTIYTLRSFASSGRIVAVQRLSEDLDAQVELVYPSSGVVCTIDAAP